MMVMESMDTTRIAGRETIPLLSFPPVERTCRQLLAWASPLLGDEAFESSRAAVKDFLVSGGAGETLRAELDRFYPADTGVLEWMPYGEQWYLSLRAALPVNSNTFYLLSPTVQSPGIPNAELAARAVIAMLEFNRNVKEELLAPDRWKGVPLCMSQYRNILGVTRVPGRDKDENLSSDTDWIAVICRGRLFRQRVLNEDGTPLPGEGLARSFAAILQCCRRSEPESFPLPALTCLPRPRWAEIREELPARSSGAARALDVVEGSLFVLCLDSEEEMNEEQLSREVFYGQPGNRWFDKSLQLVVLGQGRMGINFEHSGRDGTPIGRFVRFICEDIQNGSLASGEVPDADEVTPSAGPVLQHAVKEALDFADRLFAATRMDLLRFGDFGKDRVRELGVSPDGFLQTALFLAQDRAWGKCRSVFESIMLHHYRRGRTEGMRSFNWWTAKFIQSMRESGVSANERAGFMRKGMEAHHDRISLCMRGQGVEGHLGLLQAIAEGRMGDRCLGLLPALFSCPAWKVLQDIKITTSTISGERVEAGGFGPAQEDGLGISYLQRSGHILFSVTGLEKGERGRKSFLEQLPGALADMEQVLSYRLQHPLS